MLLEQPDVLLLDEPTNHLDADSVAWLEAFLQVKKKGIHIHFSSQWWWAPLPLTPSFYFKLRVIEGR